MTNTLYNQKLWYVVAREKIRTGKTKTFNVFARDEEGVRNIIKARGYKKLIQCINRDEVT
jgi:hypothetical protein